MRDLEPIRAVFRQACLYNHAADDLLCERLAEAMAPKPAAVGGDLPAAIAAAREAARRAKEAPSIYAGDRCHHALDDLLAALDAAQGEAVAFGRLVSGLIVDCIPASEAHAPPEVSGYAVPLYIAPPAPPAAVPAFLCDGTRFKVARHGLGGIIRGLPGDMVGQWVALVDATDGCHLKAPPAAVAAPIDFGDLCSPFYNALDELFGRGWGEALKDRRRYDPRGTKEYQDVIDVVRVALAQHPAAAVPAGYVPVSMLVEAREQVENWGAYAAPYFQDKWDLAGTLAKMDAQIAAAKGEK